MLFAGMSVSSCDPSAQLPPITDAPRADPDAQRQKGHSTDRRRADLRARRHPLDTQPDAQRPPSPDTPPRRQPPPPRSHPAPLPPPEPPPTRHPAPLAPHLSHRLILGQGSLVTTTGPPTISRHSQQRPLLYPTLLVPTARGDRRPHPKARHPLTPPLRSDERGIQRRCPPTSPLPPNPTYADGSRRVNVNRGRQRRHELQLSTLNTNRRTHLAADRRQARTANRGRPGAGLTSRTWALLPE